MPIFEYRCNGCGHEFERLQLGSDGASDCPECQDTSITRLMSVSGFRLSGKGWYETDFKTGDKRNIA